MYIFLEVLKMELAEKYISLYESLPVWAKLILALLWNIPSGIYRICKSIKAKNVLYIVLAVLLTICGGFFVLWIIDLVTIIVKNKIYWFDDLAE